MRGQILRRIPISWKLVNFGPHIWTFLESPQEGLQATKILWAKVQKQKFRSELTWDPPSAHTRKR